MLLCGKCSVPASPTYQEEKVQDPSKRMFLRILYRRWPPLGSVPLHVQGYYNKVSKHAGWGSISTVPLPCTTSQTGDITKDGPQGYLEGGRSRHQHLLSSFSGRSICLGNSGERSVHCRCMLKTANWSRESTFKQLYHRSPARPETDSAQYFKWLNGLRNSNTSCRHIQLMLYNQVYWSVSNIMFLKYHYSL